MENEKTVQNTRAKRSFFLTFLCIIGYTYTILFSLLFLVGIFYTMGNSGILDSYLNLYDLSRFNFFLFSLGGFLIFFVSFIGVFLMWKVQWLGYSIYTAAALIFIAIQLFMSKIYLPDIIVHGVFILFYFIAILFSKRKNKAKKEVSEITA
jgi:hypothetical protein